MFGLNGCYQLTTFLYQNWLKHFNSTDLLSRISLGNADAHSVPFSVF